MDAKEFRLNNKVKDHDGYMDTIVLIQPESLFLEEYGEVALNHVDPILITEEILLKCGFRKKVAETFSGGFECCYKYFKQTDTKGCEQSSKISIGRKGTEVFINDRWLCEIKYLHQLQNLYFNLSGKELVITD